jgi:signal transduction histidine kinase
MRFRRSLRYRVAISYALFGCLVSLLLATGLYIATHDLERRLIDEALTSELQDYLARRARNPESLPPATAAIRGYIAPVGRPGEDIPQPVRILPPGRYHVQLNGIPYRVAVADHGGDRFYILYDETPFNRRESYFVAFLAGGVVLMTFISALGSFWLTEQVISPVTVLARRVRELRPEDEASPLADDFPQDELGELAEAFDRYLARIESFIQRERAFTTDVSHELRTPLAIINGATEVLLSNEHVSDRVRERVARIERATRDMSELTRALLVMARETEGRGRPVSPRGVEEVLNDVLDKHRYLLANKAVSVETRIEAHPSLPVARAVLAIVLANLIRNAFTYTEQGTITVRLLADRLVVEDTGRGIREEELSSIFQRYYRGEQSQGEGIGLSLVKRICDRYGWQIELSSREGQGTIIHLIFSGAQIGSA